MNVPQGGQITTPYICHSPGTQEPWTVPWIVTSNGTVAGGPGATNGWNVSADYIVVPMSACSGMRIGCITISVPSNAPLGNYGVSYVAPDYAESTNITVVSGYGPCQAPGPCCTGTQCCD